MNLYILLINYSKYRLDNQKIFYDFIKKIILEKIYNGDFLKYYNPNLLKYL